jgi:hypothetical protein
MRSGQSSLWAASATIVFHIERICRPSTFFIIMKRLLRSYKAWIGLAVLVADGLFFSRTNPTVVSSGVLFIGVGLIIATIYLVLRTGLAVLSRYNPWFGRQKRVIVTLTIACALVLALQSIGQLSVRDGVVLVILAVLLYFYLKMVRVRTD